MNQPHQHELRISPQYSQQGLPSGGFDHPLFKIQKQQLSGMKFHINLLILLFLVTTKANPLQSHEYWYTAMKYLVEKGVPSADYAWNYCDLKCLYFEHYYSAFDFVYINFSEGIIKPNFAACFIRKLTSNGASSYSLWNTVVNNNWYNKYCGQDNIDYYALSQGSGAKYKVISVQGIGIGTYPVY